MKFFNTKKKKDPEEWQWLLQLSKKNRAERLSTGRKISQTPQAPFVISKAQTHASAQHLDSQTQRKPEPQEQQEPPEQQEVKESDRQSIESTNSMGHSKVARLLMALGPDRAASILQHMETCEIEEIVTEMSKISAILPKEKDSLIKEFSSTLQTQESVVLGGKEETRRFLIASLGVDKAQKYLEKLEVGDFEDDLQVIEKADPKILAQNLSFEHEQIIVAVLNFLSPRLAAGVLSNLETEQRLSLVRRLAQGSHIHPQTMRHITRSLRQKMSSQKKEHTQHIGGSRSLANILSFMNLEDEKEMLSAIEDDSIRQSVQNYLYTFEELLGLTDSEMRILIEAIHDDSLFVCALRATSWEMREHFLTNVSQNRRRDMEEEMENRGPMRQTEIFEARDKIIALARRLDDEGRIQIKKEKEKWV